MTKKIVYFFLIAFFFIGTAFIIQRYKSKTAGKGNTIYGLQERKGSLASTREWTKTLNNSRILFKSLAENPRNTKSSLGLAAIFIKEARITGNYAYYDLAALQQIENVLKEDPNNFLALSYKALVSLSQHHFAEGLEIATRAQKINPYNTLVYGMLVDANVELGHYKEAVINSDKMVSLRPDLPSYSRISYLREIHGDYPGAIEAMKMAVEAGLPGEDGTEWTRVQLGHLYENTGQLDSAAHMYAKALGYRKSYAPALAGLGHIAFVKKDFSNAIKFYEAADSLMVDNGIKENLAELYKRTGNIKKSRELTDQIINAMSENAALANDNENIGHYSDRELAYIFLSQNNYNKALEHALIEYERRPENIDVNQTVAWVYYKKGEQNKAVEYINAALKTNSQNPTLLCQAGLIFSKSEDKEKGKQFLINGLKNNPGIDLNLREESTKMLEQL